MAQSPCPLPPPLGLALETFSPMSRSLVPHPTPLLPPTALDGARDPSGRWNLANGGGGGAGRKRVLPNKILHMPLGGGVHRCLLLHDSAIRPTHQFCCERDRLFSHGRPNLQTPNKEPRPTMFPKHRATHLEVHSLQQKYCIFMLTTC